MAGLRIRNNKIRFRRLQRLRNCVHRWLLAVAIYPSRKIPPHDRKNLTGAYILRFTS